MDLVKESFKRVKEDMDYLTKEILVLKQEILEVKEELKNASYKPIPISLTPTHPPLNQTDIPGIPTHNYPLKPLKAQNMGFSIGNEGVPTDKQTNQQTNQHTPKTSMDDALGILNSLDNIKKGIRLKFKDLTEQEFLVFSTLYQLDEEQSYIDYRTLAQRLNLSESSVRDYVGKLIKKEIPVEKTKINNKNIRLSISENLKKIVSLSTIFQLRDL